MHARQGELPISHLNVFSGHPDLFYSNETVCCQGQGRGVIIATRRSLYSMFPKTICFHLKSFTSVVSCLVSFG